MHFVDQVLNLTVHQFGSLFTVRLRKVIASGSGGIKERKLSNLVAHTIELNHVVGNPCQAFKIIKSTCRRLAIYDFFGDTSTDEGTHLVHQV